MSYFGIVCTDLLLRCAVNDGEWDPLDHHRQVRLQNGWWVDQIKDENVCLVAHELGAVLTGSLWGDQTSLVMRWIFVGFVMEYCTDFENTIDCFFTLQVLNNPIIQE